MRGAFVSESNLVRTRAVLAGTLLCLVGAAQADVKIVSRVTVTGGTKPANTQTVTTYYKGDMVRTETDRVISLYDSKGQTITTMDKEGKTYRVLSLKTALAAAPGVLSRLRFKTTADMHPQEETAVIAGLPARKYLGRATFAMSVAGVPGNAAPPTVMEIEQWATEAVSLPSGSIGMTNPFLRLAGPLQQMKGMEPLVQAMSKVKGTPLSNRFTITVGSADGASKGPVVTDNEVESVSSEPLAPALFKVPEGFTKVEARSIPSAPAALRSRGARPKDAHAHP